MRHPRFAVCFVVLSIVALSAPLAAQEAHERWVGSWATAQVSLPPPDPSAAPPEPAPPIDLTPPHVDGQTIRQVVRLSAGGDTLRVVLANTYGMTPVEVGAAHVAVHEMGAVIDASRGASLTFGGSPSATIEIGSTLVSDPVALAIEPLTSLAVDLYLPGDTWASTATGHGLAWATSYISTPGDHVGAAELPVATTVQSWLYLDRVDVRASVTTPVVVAFGDSITEGFGSTTDANRRWPDLLAERLVEEYGDDAPPVLNGAISGNRVLSHNALGLLGGPAEDDAGFGPSALSRFDRDVLLQPGATHVVIMESINDIGFGGEAAEPTAAQIIGAHRGLIQRAKARGLVVYGATLTPFEGAMYFTETGERKRQAVNEWIRSSGAYDAVLDFDAVVRDPAMPRRIRADWHAGDWLHPNDAGYRAMADAVDLSLFAP